MLNMKVPYSNIEQEANPPTNILTRQVGFHVTCIISGPCSRVTIASSQIISPHQGFIQSNPSTQAEQFDQHL